MATIKQPRGAVVSGHAEWQRCFYDPAYWRRCDRCSLWIIPDFDRAPDAQRTVCVVCAP